MADLSDVTALLARSADAAVYPNGDASPSIVGVDVKIFEGWPDQPTLDADIAAGKAQVSIFPMRGGQQSVAQYLDEPQEVVVAPVLGLVVAVNDRVVTITGAPALGEYLSITVDDRNTYSYGLPSIDAMLHAIASDAAADGLNPQVGQSTITFLNAYRLTARSGAAGKVARVTHRQRQPVMVTVWAPIPALRSAIAAAIDAKIKASLRVTFPDGSQGIVRSQDTYVSDDRVNVSIYRRDLTYSVEYATLDTYDATEITSFNASLDLGQSQVGRVASIPLSMGDS